MDVKRLNIYKRLRDFKVPTTVLDNIFSEKDDSEILVNAYDALLSDGFKDDDAAMEISKMILNELNLKEDSHSEFGK